MPVLTFDDYVKGVTITGKPSTLGKSTLTTIMCGKQKWETLRVTLGQSEEGTYVSVVTNLTYQAFTPDVVSSVELDEYTDEEYNNKFGPIGA